MNIGCLTVIVLNMMNSLIFAQKPSIETVPKFRNNVVATGYTGLTLRAEFNTESEECRWDLLDMHSVVVFSSTQPCRDRPDGSTCVKTSIGRNESRIVASYTIAEPINTTLDVTIGCTDGVPTPTLRINVADCSSDFPLIVQSSSAMFDAEGEFRCANNGILVDPNKDELPQSSTRCLATTKWSGSDVLGCWKAPSVDLDGEVSVMEGERLSFACEYDDVHPEGSKSIFYLGDVGFILDKGQRFETPRLSRADNKKQVLCQAVTPLTQRFNDTGRSNTQFIKVLYAPYQENITKCFWSFNQTQLCRIMFFTGTNVEVIEVRKNGEPTDGIITELKNLSDDVRELYYVENNVTSASQGNYEVYLRSQIAPFNHTIEFVIEMNDDMPAKIVFSPKPAVKSDDFFKWIVVVGCIAGYSVLITIVSTILCFKLKKIKVTSTTKTLNTPKKLKIVQDQTHYLQPIKNAVYQTAKDIDSPDEKVNPFSSHEMFMTSEITTSKENKLGSFTETDETSKVHYEEIADYHGETSPRKTPPGYEVMFPQKNRPYYEETMQSSKI